MRRRGPGIFDLWWALQKFGANLMKGDPVALGLLGFFLLLMTIAGVIWWVDRKSQKKEQARSNGRGRGR